MVGKRHRLGFMVVAVEGHEAACHPPRGVLCGALLQVLFSFGAAAVSLPRTPLALAALRGNTHGSLMLSDPEFHTYKSHLQAPPPRIFHFL